MVRMFDDGDLVSEIIPEVWMLNGYSTRLEGSVETRAQDSLTMVSRPE